MRRRLLNLSLLLVVLCALVLGVLPAPKASAATSIFTSHAWVDSAGNNLSNISNSTFTSRFKFTDTDTIVDNSTGKTYTLPGNINPAGAMNDNAASNGPCLSNGCDQDDFYGSNHGHHHPKTYYWYWSSKDPGVPDPTTGKCLGGFLVSDDLDDHPYVYINFMPTILGGTPQSPTCLLYDRSSVLTGSVDNDTFISSHPTLRTDSRSGANPHMENLGSSITNFAAYTTWTNSNEVDFLDGSNSLKLLDPTTEPDAYNLLKAHIQSGHSTSRYASGYNYFVSDACGGTAPSVILAISSIGYPVGYLLHDNKPGGDSGSGDVYANWYGKDFSCLFGNDGVDHNPLELIVGGNSNFNNGDIRLLLLNTANAKKAPDTNFTPPGSGGTGNGDGSAPQLSCKAGWNPLNWLICGIVDGLSKIVNSVDSFISSQLSVGTDGNSDDPSQIFGSSTTAQSYYKAWSAFRDLALGLLVVAGLIVIITQALGFEILDAYTLRKVLPRLVVAAIAITISWSLMQFFVTLTNDLGFGIRSLIYAPFSSLGGTKINLGGTPGLAVSLASGAAIVSLGIFGLLSFIGTAALAVFVAFLVLVIRQILIIVLILIAPVAIVAYILPNTNKMFKIWWDSFAKALMMFPLISAFIAAGRVMSEVANPANSPNPSPFNQFIAFAAYFAPYMLLPLTFRFAGGALSNIGGFVNDKHKGGFDRLRNFRGKKMNENMQKVGNYSRFSDNNKLGRGINTVLGAGANPRNLMGGVAGVRKGRAAGRAAQGAANFKDNKVIQDNQHDDNFWAALANRKFAEDKLSEHQTAYDDARTRGDTVGMNKARASMLAQQNGLDAAAQVSTRGSRATQKAAYDALTKTGYQISYGEDGYNEMSKMARNIAGSDDGEYTKLMDQGQYNMKEAGRYDQAGINHGAGYDPATGLGKVDPYTLGARGKPQSVTAKGDLIHSSLIAADAARAAGDMDTYHSEMEKASVHRNELRTGFDGATDANRDEFIKQLGRTDALSTDATSAATGGVMDAWSTSASGRTRVDPTTGAAVPVTIQERQQYVAGSSPTAGAGAWTPGDVARGHRTVERLETRGDIARSKSKGLSRMPNPSEL